MLTKELIVRHVGPQGAVTSGSGRPNGVQVPLCPTVIFRDRRGGGTGVR